MSANSIVSYLRAGMRPFHQCAQSLQWTRPRVGIQFMNEWSQLALRTEVRTRHRRESEFLWTHWSKREAKGLSWTAAQSTLPPSDWQHSKNLEGKRPNTDGVLTALTLDLLLVRSILKPSRGAGLCQPLSHSAYCANLPMVRKAYDQLQWLALATLSVLSHRGIARIKWDNAIKVLGTGLRHNEYPKHIGLFLYSDWIILSRHSAPTSCKSSRKVPS